MPPKRKSASNPDPVEPPPKRATRAGQPVASTSSAAAPKVKVPPSKAKAAPRKKAVEVVEVESSDADDSDDMVIDEPKGKKRAPAPAPAPKKTTKKAVKSSAGEKQAKKAPVNAAPAPAPVASTSAKNSIDQEYIAEGVQGLTSTSTTPLPEPAPKSKPKPKPKSPKKPVSWEQGLKDWFAEYEDEPGTMGGEGIERLFLDMDVSMEGPAPFILAYKVRAKPGTFGSFAFDDFQATFREPKVNSNASLKAYLAAAEKDLFAQTSTGYDAFYAWTFSFVKEEGQKSLAGEMGTALWRILLQPKFNLAKSFVDYTETLGASFKGVSSDLWHQLLEFVKSTDENLAGFNEMDAWPTVIDQFVEWKKEQDASS